MAIRVLLADDQAMVRAGFAMILGAQQDMEVVGEAADGEEVIAESNRLAPDVIVMDIQMPKLDGVAATRAVLAQGHLGDPPLLSGSADAGGSGGRGALKHHDAPRVLIVTTFDIDEFVYEALRAGAAGFLLKNAPPEELVYAVRVVAAGDCLLAPKVTRRVIEAFCQHPAATAPPAGLQELTAREREVLELVARGLSNGEIAERLFVGHGTVKTHVARILMKLHIDDRVQAVVLAYETGLVTPGHSNPSHPA